MFTQNLGFFLLWATWPGMPEASLNMSPPSRPGGQKQIALVVISTASTCKTTMRYKRLTSKPLTNNWTNRQ